MPSQLGWHELVEAMTRLHPAERLQSMDEVMELLEKLLGGKMTETNQEEKAPDPELEEEKPAQPMMMQASVSDFGLYQCVTSGKRAIGFVKESHAREVHGWQSVKWNKVV